MISRCTHMNPSYAKGHLSFYKIQHHINLHLISGAKIFWQKNLTINFKPRISLLVHLSLGSDVQYPLKKGLSKAILTWEGISPMEMRSESRFCIRTYKIRGMLNLLKSWHFTQSSTTTLTMPRSNLSYTCQPYWKMQKRNWKGVRICTSPLWKPVSLKSSPSAPIALK